MNDAVSENPRVIVALDYANGDQARQFVDRLEPGSCRLKIGKELFTREGPELVRYFTANGHEVFLDLKFHDIPNTVAQACVAAASLGAWMINVHASGGRKMMSAAREALEGLGDRRPLLIGVTVLTSLDRGDLDDLGFKCDVRDLVLSRAKQCLESGCDGVISSGLEVPALREFVDEKLLVVSPGIRPVDNKPVGDQKRVVTVETAFQNGCDYIVVGRPIRDADSPRAAAEAMQASIEERIPRSESLQIGVSLSRG